ncbi:hypothetical protein DXT68_01365 [Microbacterium foliorum]|uniref:DUF7882 domain-containing protein n=1 Tax=Microbacterium foliorum TaxID=104336 RepID=A0A0F0KWU6_9MICO|nr:hypothetical protein [Microbacterium foliorum]AXL10941.1 hypothetical protein DXT68_01365 [Microbacterium foliorum]KJL24570.1 hypothetical protein RN50_00682 [Microbacterium foliorum]CAH0142126.1 hypothetical protein SRABI44_00501 [Microbacterium foliorum]CAH0246086.1 hypothetical protein SRABI03_03094 [Microbacterium foliorum]
MGYLTYGNTAERIEIDDQTLTHLRMVAMTKLRRNESFPLTLEMADGVIETLWVHASIPLRIAMDRPCAIDRDMVTAMMHAAGSAGGLDLTREEFASAVSTRRSLHAIGA